MFLLSTLLVLLAVMAHTACAVKIYAMAQWYHLGLHLHQMDSSSGQLTLVNVDAEVRTEFTGTSSGLACVHGNNYYYFGQSQSGELKGKPVLVGLSTIDASQTCLIDLSKSIAIDFPDKFTGSGVTVNYNSEGNNIMISGPSAANDTSQPHAIITVDLNDYSITALDTTYGYSDNQVLNPLYDAHSSAMDSSGILYATLQMNGTTSGMHIVDTSGANPAKYIQCEGTPFSNPFWGVQINEESGSQVLVGVSASVTEPWVPALTRVSNSRSDNPKITKIFLTDPANGIVYQQMDGNDGSVNAFDSAKGVIYIIAIHAPLTTNGYTLLGVDVTNGEILSAVPLLAAPGNIDPWGNVSKSTIVYHMATVSL